MSARQAVRENALSIAFGLLLLVVIAAQAVVGRLDYNERAPGRPASPRSTCCAM